MVGLLSDPIGNPAVNADPSAFAPSSTFGRVDPMETLKQFGRGIETHTAELGVMDPNTGQQVVPPEPNITPAEANQRYGVDGHLSFSSPVPASVAADMQSAKQDEMRRQDAASRSPGGVGTKLTDFGAGMLDPVNVAAGFIPVVGEARFGGMLAKAGLGGLVGDGAGILARSAVRAGSGALDAGLVQAPLIGARYGLSRQEGADYTAQDALLDLGMGSLLGGGLHASFGAASDLVGALRGERTATAAPGAAPDLDGAPGGVTAPGEPQTPDPASTQAEAPPAAAAQASLFGDEQAAGATEPTAAATPAAEAAAPASPAAEDTPSAAGESSAAPAAVLPAAEVPDAIRPLADDTDAQHGPSVPAAEAEPPHPGSTAASDPVGDAFRASPSAALVDADPQLREAVLRSSIAAAAEGRPVAANELLQVAAAERGSIPPPAPGADRAVYAPGVPPIQVRPEVVPLDSLVASHAPDGTLNPAYPHDTGIQPRDRTSPQSQADVRSIAAGLQPERMDVSPEAQSGAPIVSPDGVVESGNGRTMALGQVYADPALADRATAYRDWLQGQGYDTTGIDKPVLVARRLSDLTPEQTRDFGRAANEATTLRMTAAETARADAARAGAALDLWRGSAVTDAGNRDFVRAFLGQLPSAERGNLVDRSGGLSADGARRIQSAVLALVYGDSLGPTLERMLNGDAEGMRAIAGAISDAAGSWGQMRLAAERGEIPANLDITAPLGEAVQLVERQRRAGRPVAEAFAQADVFGGGPSPDAAALARLMFRDDAMAKPVGRARLGDLLWNYADQAREVSPAANMFGEPPAGPADILAAISQRPDVIAQSGFAFGRDAAADRLEELQQSPAVRRAQGAPDPEQAAIEQRAAVAGKARAAPPVDLLALEAFARDARERGILDAQSESELAASDDSAQRSQKYTDALEQAAGCIARSTI